MASLLPNIQQNRATQNATYQPQNLHQNIINQSMTNMPTQATYMSRPPYGQYAMFTGFMSAILGGLWYAKPKHNVNDLTTMSDDKFINSTKKAKESMPTAWEAFANTRKEIIANTNKNLNLFFGNNKETTVKNILQKLKKSSEEALEKSINNLSEKIEKFMEIDHQTFFENISSSTKLTAEQKELLKDALGDDILKEIETKKVANIKDFITQKYKQLGNQLQKEKYGQLLCNNASNGVVHKSLIQNQTKHFFIDSHIRKLETYYHEISPKLPKKAFKTMAKWFAFGYISSLTIDAIFNFIRSKNSAQ